MVKKNLGEKLVKMLGFCQNELLDKSLTFRIVCVHILMWSYVCWKSQLFRDQVITDFLIITSNQILENCPLENLDFIFQ